MRLVSRRKLAKYAAEQLLAGNGAVLEEIAGLLVYEKHEREVELLVRDIEVELAECGTIVATVESARALDGAARQEVEGLLSSAARRRDAGFAPGFRSGNLGCRAPSDDRATHATERVELPDTKVSGGRDIQVRLREVVRSELIGGVKITTPTQVMDATVLKKLNDLRAKKI